MLVVLAGLAAAINGPFAVLFLIHLVLNVRNALIGAVVRRMKW